MASAACVCFALTFVTRVTHVTLVTHSSSITLNDFISSCCFLGGTGS